MIISNKHKFVFVAVPKTGTHSVRRALRKHMGPDDHEQVRLFEQSALPWQELSQLKHGHIALRQLAPVIGDKAFTEYFKFAFVRNPFDRFVSYCAFIRREDGAFERDPKAVMRAAIADPPNRHILFAPQSYFLTSFDGSIMADEIGRVEDMQVSYDRICARLGIPSETLERANTSNHGDYRQYYDEDMIKGVSQLYAKDLDLFGYKF